jgi:hypothetical protein
MLRVILYLDSCLRKLELLGLLSLSLSYYRLLLVFVWLIIILPYVKLFWVVIISFIWDWLFLTRMFCVRNSFIMLRRSIYDV